MLLTRVLGGNRLLDYLYNHHLARGKDVLDTALLLQDGPYLYLREQRLVVRILVYLPYELVERTEIQPQVEIMHESLLFIADVHKGGIQGRKYFLHLPEIHVPDGEVMALARLLVELDQLVVFQQSYRDFR